MKELLTEFLRTILIERKIEVSIKDQAPGTVEKTAGDRWRAKQVGTNKIEYFGEKQLALSWAQGKYGAVGGSPTDAPIGSNIPKDLLGRRRKNTSVVDKPSAAQQDVKGILAPAMDKIKKTLSDLRTRGIAGSGGAAASQGESLFTQFGNALREHDGIMGVLELARPKKGFRQLVDDYSINEKTAGSKLASNMTQLKKLKNIRATIAKDFGWGDYDDENPEDEERQALYRETIAEYLAIRQTYIKNELEEAQRACAKGKEHVFCKKGTAGFGENEDVYTSWLEAAFDGSVRLDSLIRSGDTRLDPEQPWTVLQSDFSDEAKSGNYSPDQLVLKQLESLRDSSQGEDRDHYDYQIKLFEKLGFHDTLIVGYDTKGRLAVLHDSNKKSSDLDDPHNNTTPETRLTSLQERYKNQPKLTVAAQKMVEILDDQLLLVRDIKAGTVRSAARLEITPDMVVLAESSHMEKYMSNIDTLADTNRRGSFGFWLNEQGMDWESLNTKEKLEAMQKFMVINPEKTYSSFGYVFAKMGEFAATKKVLQDVFGTSEVSGLNGPLEIKRTEADSVNQTYQTVVNKLRAADVDEGHTPPPENGSHTQMYIDSVADALHINTYIDNYDKDMIMSIGRHAVTPAEVRDTLMSILPREFTDTIDINTPEGKAALKKYLRENCRIDAESGALVVSTPDGECSIGEDVWRTAGKTAKVATSFGLCFRERLRERTSQKPVLFL